MISAIPLPTRSMSSCAVSIWWQQRSNIQVKISAIVSGAALLALALPTLQLHTQLPSFTDLPKSLPIVATYDRIQAAFPGSSTPAEVVLKAPDVTAPQVRRAVQSLERRALASGQVEQPVATEVNPARTVEIVSLPLVGNGDDSRSVAALADEPGVLEHA